MEKITEKKYIVKTIENLQVGDNVEGIGCIVGYDEEGYPIAETKKGKLALNKAGFHYRVTIIPEG